MVVVMVIVGSHCNALTHNSINLVFSVFVQLIVHYWFAVIIVTIAVIWQIYKRTVTPPTQQCYEH